MKILIVEDEPALRAGLADLLSAAGHTVLAVGDGLAALEEAAAAPPELVLLDWMLPKLDGLAVCQRLRALSAELPILILTAKGAEEDVVAGLRSGADDYLKKPFGTRELLARVDALARRQSLKTSALAGEGVIEIDGCRFELGRFQMERADGGSVGLSARETAILRLLHGRRERAVSRAEFLEKVWAANAEMDTRTVDMTIANLRQKIERDPARPRLILTVKGVGYRWGASD